MKPIVVVSVMYRTLEVCVRRCLSHFELLLMGSLSLPLSQGSQSLNPTSSSEHGTRVFGRFRARHQRGSSLNEETLGSRTVDLHTSIIKMDAEDAELRLCFRIISPSKTYTLQVKWFAVLIHMMI